MAHTFRQLHFSRTVTRTASCPTSHSFLNQPNTHVVVILEEQEKIEEIPTRKVEYGKKIEFKLVEPTIIRSDPDSHLLLQTKS